MQVIITKDELRKALFEWESLNRSGGCIPENDAAEKPIEKRVNESVEYLWRTLTK